MSESFDPFEAASTLLIKLGYPCPDSVLALPGGRNNQVWRVGSVDCDFLLKRYFWSEQDPRDRLSQEWKFLEYLWQQGCERVPKPFIFDESIRCALLEFVEGTPPQAQEVTAADVHAAADFFLEINSGREHAVALPPASEACFSIEAHLATTSARVGRLATIQPATTVHTAALGLVQDSIHPLWNQIEDRIRSVAKDDLTRVLSASERCISPSDFGFHNSIRQSDHTLRFVDFEYAGWDDPAKTIIDFCNQPDGILSNDNALLFRRRTMDSFPPANSFRERIRLLEPVYQLKWACICLNGFLPGRHFDRLRPDRTPEAQLARATLMTQRAASSVNSEVEW